MYPVSLNHHERQVLAWAVLPAPIAPELARQARQLATDIAAALEVEGLLVVEMFVTTDGRLLVNELAPRPHNTFHSTELACATSQFEQAVRAICDLPLGDTTALRPAAIVNLFGDLWLSETPPPFDAAPALPPSLEPPLPSPALPVGSRPEEPAAPASPGATISGSSPQPTAMAEKPSPPTNK